MKTNDSIIYMPRYVINTYLILSPLCITCIKQNYCLDSQISHIEVAGSKNGLLLDLVSLMAEDAWDCAKERKEVIKNMQNNILQIK